MMLKADPENRRLTGWAEGGDKEWVATAAVDDGSIKDLGFPIEWTREGEGRQQPVDRELKIDETCPRLEHYAIFSYHVRGALLYPQRARRWAALVGEKWSQHSSRCLLLGCQRRWMLRDAGDRVRKTRKLQMEQPLGVVVPFCGARCEIGYYYLGKTVVRRFFSFCWNQVRNLRVLLLCCL